MEEPPEDLAARVCACPLLAVAPAWIVLPGNAWAATSESSAVRATLPAITQRLTRRSFSSAASRTLAGRSFLMRTVWLKWLSIR